MSRQVPTRKVTAAEARAYLVKAIGRTLEAVLLAFFHTEDLSEGALKVVNLGQDADTTGAIFGQIAGAHYGAKSTPDTWQQRLKTNTETTSMAGRLHERALLG